MKTASYLNFDGDCAVAFAKYAEVFGGNIEFMMRFGEVPASEGMDMSSMNPDGVMHALLRLPCGSALMASDVPPGMYQKPQGFSVSMSEDTVEEVNRVFAALSEGGTVTMPVTETFWSEAFAMFTDRWGTPWMLNGPQKEMG